MDPDNVLSWVSSILNTLFNFMWVCQILWWRFFIYTHKSYMNPLSLLPLLLNRYFLVISKIQSLIFIYPWTPCFCFRLPPNTSTRGGAPPIYYSDTYTLPPDPLFLVLVLSPLWGTLYISSISSASVLVLRPLFFWNSWTLSILSIFPDPRVPYL